MERAVGRVVLVRITLDDQALLGVDEIHPSDEVRCIVEHHELSLRLGKAISTDQASSPGFELAMCSAQADAFIEHANHPGRPRGARFDASSEAVQRNETEATRFIDQIAQRVIIELAGHIQQGAPGGGDAEAIHAHDVRRGQLPVDRPEPVGLSTTICGADLADDPRFWSQLVKPKSGVATEGSCVPHPPCSCSHLYFHREGSGGRAEDTRQDPADPA